MAPSKLAGRSARSRTTPGRTSPVGRAVRDVWDANADFWDERMADGNLTHRYLVAPPTERLLALQPGEEVLEIACGNGQFTRRLAQLGAKVLAVDFSEGMLRHARARSRTARGTIEYRRLDAADGQALRSLGTNRFAAVVCNMALMDMAEIAPLASALPTLLAEGGRFVFSVAHPCFNTGGMRRIVEDEDAGGTMVDRAGVYVYRYLTPTTSKGLAMIGQPRPQYYFERPLSALLRPFLENGLALDGLEEPQFPPNVRGPKRMSWFSVPEIPYILVVRLRVGGPSREPGRPASRRRA
ncbi:MAG: class I SAM-dependent methyltransferase [Thermoplasmata archaeon]|nr:class I SAM-dependent methyltransferase [Thermoplasmata archaeon]